MFSSFPQRLTAPFGLLGDEAKLAFTSQPGGIVKLATVRNISENDSYWEQYFVLFTSASDVYSLIRLHHLRRALIEAPENIVTLIRVVTIRLFNLVSDHTFPSSSNGTVTAFASSIINRGMSERNTTKEVLNCLRILQRVLPVIFEVEGETDSFERRLLWQNGVAEEREDEQAELAQDAAPQFVIEDESEGEGDGSRPFPTSSAQPKPKILLPSLAERLFTCLIDLMFCCGFTIPTKLQVNNHKINFTIWEKGVGSTVDPGPNHAYDGNKTEVLRLLLVLLSRQIYSPPGSLFTKPPLYTLHLVQNMSRRDVLTVLCSLLNTAMSPTNFSDSGFSGMTGKLPYNHLVFKGEDSRVNLVSMCLQVLCVVLDFQGGSAKDEAIDTVEAQTAAPTAKTNSFRYFLMKLHRSRDFDFILDGITGILNQQMVASNNLFPGSVKPLPYAVETIIFLWKMIELNKKFRSYIIDSDRSNDILAYILNYHLDSKDKPQQRSLCRAISYIIQTLSAEPAFGPKLRNPLKVQPLSKWAVAGSAADFLINAVYIIVSTTQASKGSQYPTLIIALSNAAPHFVGLSPASSTRLLQLYTTFSSAQFLLSDEGHPRLLFFILEVFNSIIYHHISENPNVIYAILTSHKLFQDLGVFTLAGAMQEIKRAHAAKDELPRRLSRGARGKISGEGTGTSDVTVEKARLFESEQVQSEARRDSSENAGTIPHASVAHERGRESEAQTTLVTQSLMSPTQELSADHLDSPMPSKKAQGKMREQMSSLDTSHEGLMAMGIGRNGFVPTQEWITSWQQGLPLDTVMLMISELLPKIQPLLASRKANSTSSIIDFLSSVTLDGILPRPPPITARKFTWTDASIIWLTSLIWGEIYVRAMSPLGVWNATNVRLFYVKHTQNQQRHITETVSSVVSGLLRLNVDSQPTRQRIG